MRRREVRGERRGEEEGGDYNQENSKALQTQQSSIETGNQIGTEDPRRNSRFIYHASHLQRSISEATTWIIWIKQMVCFTWVSRREKTRQILAGCCTVVDSGQLSTIKKLVVVARWIEKGRVDFFLSHIKNDN